MYGYDVCFANNNMVKFTLAGLRRMLGDAAPNRPTLHIQDLKAMYRCVNLMDIQERTMWACIVFRSLLRKSNLVVSHSTDCHVLRWSSLRFFPWGVLITISSTETIQFGQRTITLPITYAHGSPLCAVYWLQRHLLDVPSSDPNAPLFLVRRGQVNSPLSYATVLNYLKTLLRRVGKDEQRTGLHSLRRSGAAYMHSIGLTLEDIRQAGDWQSLAALIYLAKPLQGRIDSDKRVSSSLQALGSFCHT